MVETAWLLPILWYRLSRINGENIAHVPYFRRLSGKAYTWQLHDARSGLRAYRASLALLAEQTQPQGPHKLAEVCRFLASQTSASTTQDHAQHLVGPGTAK